MPKLQFLDDDFRAFVQQVINGKHLDGPALGIAKRVVDRGEDSLTGRQRFVFNEHVLKHYTAETCAECPEAIPWCEMYAAVQIFDGKCSWCVQLHGKD
jgi:hypothetical protein